MRAPTLRLNLDPEPTPFTESLREWGYLPDDEIIVDSFAGGGGASEGIRFALGRDPDIAINHDAEAIALHAANHPGTQHLVENVWKVDPVATCAGRPVGLMWASPDCKHFSKAKGGKPVSKKIRGLAWVVTRWAKAVKPRMIFLENVEEFQGWGPVLANGQPCPVRKGKTFRAFVSRLRRLGYVVDHRELRACDYGAPTIRKRLFLIARCDGQPIVWPKPTHGKGTPKPWRTAAECIDWSLTCPSIFTRKKPLAENTLKRIGRGLKRFVIDSPRPFIVNMAHGGKVEDVATPMSTIATEKGGCRAVVAPMVMKAHSHGWDKNGGPIQPADRPTWTVVAKDGSALVAPTLVSLTHQGSDDRVESIEEPFKTLTGAHRGEKALVAAHITKFRNGATGSAGDEPMPTVTANSFIKRPGGAAPLGLVTGCLVPRYGEAEGQEPRARNVEEPMATIVPGGNEGSLATAFLAKHYGDTGQRPGSGLEEPVSTVTASDHNALVAAHIQRNFGTSTGAAADTPLPTTTADAGGGHSALIETRLAPTAVELREHVRAFLVAYYGNEKDGGDLFDPLRTLSTRDRFGLVTVGGVEYQIADIGMRMLAPRELYNAQGFRADYRIEITYKGKPLTKTAQVRMVGNSVCPPMAAALIRANCAIARQAVAA